VIDVIHSHTEDEVVDALICDDAASEVRDVRDFFWPPQASNGRERRVPDRPHLRLLRRVEAAGEARRLQERRQAEERAVAGDRESFDERERGCATSTAPRTTTRSSSTGRPSA
jgi:hypothetical protein